MKKEQYYFARLDGHSVDFYETNKFNETHVKAIKKSMNDKDGKQTPPLSLFYIGKERPDM